jgi:hypothetical protein
MWSQAGFIALVQRAAQHARSRQRIWQLLRQQGEKAQEADALERLWVGAG